MADALGIYADNFQIIENSILKLFHEIIFKNGSRDNGKRIEWGNDSSKVAYGIGRYIFMSGDQSFFIGNRGFSPGWPSGCIAAIFFSSIFLANSDM